MSDALASDSFNIWEKVVDPRTGTTTGEPRKMTNSDGYGYSGLSVTKDLHSLVFNKLGGRTDVYVGELRSGGTLLNSLKRLTVSESTNISTAWTSDGKAILFSSTRTGRYQMFKQSVGQETAEALTPGPDGQFQGEPSPDGKWILYWSQVEGSPGSQRLMRLPASGGAPEQVLETQDSSIGFDCPSNSARTCLLSRWEEGHLTFYPLDPVQGQGKQVGATKISRPDDLRWSISGDGSRIAITSRDQLKEQIRILNLQDGTEHNLQLPQGWYIWSLTWARDGRALFAAAQSADYMIVRIGLDGKASVLLNKGRENSLGGPISSPDGRYLGFTQTTWENNVWLVENF